MKVNFATHDFSSASIPPFYETTWVAHIVVFSWSLKFGKFKTGTARYR